MNTLKSTQNDRELDQLLIIDSSMSKRAGSLFTIIIQSPVFYSVLIAVVTLLVFEQTLSGKFLMWDDNWCIYQNPTFGGLSFKNLYLIFTNATVSSSWYTPLTGLTWCITYQLYKLNPFGYHLVDWLFHAANAVLVFTVLRKLLVIGLVEQIKTGETQFRITVSAALATLFWSLHPLRVEAVAWAACSYGQALFLLLLSLITYLRANEANVTILSHRIYMAASVALFAASLLTQPVGLGFVIVLVVLDLYPFKRLNGARLWNFINIRQVLLDKLPFIVVSAIIVLINMAIIVYSPRGGHKAVSLADFGLINRLMQGMYIWAYYLWRPWYPLNLSPVYTTLVSFKPLSLPFILNGLTVVGIFMVLVFQRRRWPLGLALGISYLALLAPVLGVTDHPYYPNDRYSLIPSLCWSVLLAVWLARFKICYFSRSFVVTIIIVIIMFFGLLSFRQTQIWNNNITFFKHIIKVLEDDPYRRDIHWRLGLALAQQGNFNRAIHHFRKTLEIDPSYHFVRYFLATALAKKDILDEAISNYRLVLRYNPDHVRALEGIGLTLLKQGKTSEAVKKWQKVLRLKPNDPYIHYDLGLIMYKQDDFDKAIGHYKEAIRLKPGWINPMINLARIFATNKKSRFRNPLEAIQLAKRACELTNYEDPRVLDVLAEAYVANNDFLNSVKTYEKALELAIVQNKIELSKTIQRRLKLYKASKRCCHP